MVLPQFPFQDSLISIVFFLTTTFLLQYTTIFFLLVFPGNSDFESKIVEAIVALNSPRKLGLTGAVHFVGWLKMFFSIFIFLKWVLRCRFFWHFLDSLFEIQLCRFSSLDGLIWAKALQVRHCRTPLQMCDSQKEDAWEFLFELCLQMGFDVTTSWSYLGSKDPVWLESSKHFSNLVVLDNHTIILGWEFTIDNRIPYKNKTALLQKAESLLFFQDALLVISTIPRKITPLPP